MDQEQSYGKPTKRVVFTETEHNHAQLILKLRHDSVSQAAFFRTLVRAYIEHDDRVQQVIAEISQQSKARKHRSKKHRDNGKELSRSLGCTEGDVEDIFDLIAEEHPDL